MAVNANLSVSLDMSQSGTVLLGNEPKWVGNLSHIINLIDGTTANKFDLLYVGERTVASASNDDLDLAGVLSTPLGSTITSAKVVGIIIVNAPKSGSDNTTTLTLGGGTNPFAGFLGGTTPTVTKIGPGAIFMLVSPNSTGIGTVTAGTGDILRVANSSGASATYQIVILARSA